MKEQIYQNGFYFCIGIFVGLLIGVMSVKSPTLVKKELKVTVVPPTPADTVKVKPAPVKE